MARVIYPLRLTVLLLTAVIAVTVLWVMLNPFSIHLSDAFAGEVTLSPNQKMITGVLTAFGSAQQNVDLSASDAPETIKKEYGPYVMPHLLAQWESDPTSAPGQTASTSRPDHITIQSFTPTPTGFTVDATLFYADATTTSLGGDPLVITFVIKNHQWMIDSYTDASSSQAVAGQS